MRLLDVLNAPWAIVPEKLLEIREIYFTHLRGEKIDLRSIEARLGQPLNNEHQGYEVVDGVAVLPIEGVIAKRMNLFTRVSGGVSTQLLERDFKAALSDDRAHSILLSVDSPGGNVDGVFELARAICDARGRKPVVALGNGMMASASYWIASAADRVLITGETTQVGSIGVVATHTDISKAEEMRGVKTTEITAGKYKRIASEHRPLSDEARAAIQEQVDHVYSVFVNEVARHRGTDVETVLDKMADGRIFLGSKAIDAGLVDGVSTKADLIRQLNQEHEQRTHERARAVARQILNERRNAWKAKR
jgi:signal peptide peptidase SppA